MNTLDITNVTRLEIIGPHGLEWTKWGVTVEVSLQDGGRTLKLFYTSAIKCRYCNDTGRRWDNGDKTDCECQLKEATP